MTFYTVQPSHYETEIGGLDFCSIFDITWRVGKPIKLEAGKNKLLSFL